VLQSRKNRGETELQLLSSLWAKYKFIHEYSLICTRKTWRESVLVWRSFQYLYVAVLCLFLSLVRNSPIFTSNKTQFLHTLSLSIHQTIYGNGYSDRVTFTMFSYLLSFSLYLTLRTRFQCLLNFKRKKLRCEYYWTTWKMMSISYRYHPSTKEARLCSIGVRERERKSKILTRTNNSSLFRQILKCLIFCELTNRWSFTC